MRLSRSRPTRPSSLTMLRRTPLRTRVRAASSQRSAVVRWTPWMRPILVHGQTLDVREAEQVAVAHRDGGQGRLQGSLEQRAVAAANLRERWVGELDRYAQPVEIAVAAAALGAQQGRSGADRAGSHPGAQRAPTRVAGDARRTAPVRDQDALADDLLDLGDVRLAHQSPQGAVEGAHVVVLEDGQRRGVTHGACGSQIEVGEVARIDARPLGQVRGQVGRHVGRIDGDLRPAGGTLADGEAQRVAELTGLIGQRSCRS